MKKQLQKKSLWSMLGMFLIIGIWSVQVNAQAIADFEDGGLVPQKMSIFGQGTVTMADGIIDNPAAGGINTSAKVFGMCKGPGAQEWGGFWFETDTLNDATFVLTDKTVFCIDVMMPHNGIVQFKVEKGVDDANKAAIKLDYTGNGEWQQICYDFSGTIAEGGSFRRIAIFPNRGEKPSVEECYFIDNVIQMAELPSTGPEGLFVDFEDNGLVPQKLSIFGQGGVTMPDGVIDNPSKSGINTSGKVFSMCKGPGAQEWGGFWLETDTLNDATFVLTDKTVFCIDVMMPHNGIVQFKVEKGVDDANKAAIKLDYTGNGEWQQICYDFSGTTAEGGSFRRIAVFPNRGEKPDPEECYLIDNFLHLSEMPTQVDGTILVDWEDGSLVPQKSSIFGQGTVTNITGKVQNPNPSGINTSDNVFAMCKGPGAQEWGGLWFEIDTLNDAAFDLANGNVLCIDVMMPVNGVVQLKLEQGPNNGMKTAIKTDYTGNGEWQQVCYDFTGTDAEGLSFRRVAVFPNRGVQPAEEECYHVDNLIQKTPGPPSTLGGEIIGDWESVFPTVNISGTGATQIQADNPASDNINNSARVLKYCIDETTVEPFAGLTITVDTFDVTGDTAQIYISYFAAEANTLRITLKGATDGSADVSMDVAYTTPGAWEQLIYDFRTSGVDGKEAAGHIYSAIKLAPGFGAVPTAETCFHIDDVLKNTNGTGVLREFISTTIGFSSSHSLFKGYIDLADMSSAVNATGVTVFAPSDDAINALSVDDKNALDNNVDGALIAFILHHVTNDSLPVSLLNEDKSVITRDGLDIDLAADGTIGGASIIEGDVINSNGILHYIDAVVATGIEPSKIVIEDFEADALNQLDQTFFGFNYGSDSTSNIFLADNPAPDDVNNSAKVIHHIKFPKSGGVESWQGFALKDIARPMNFMGAVKEVCADVLMPKAGELRMKFSGPTIEPLAGDDSTKPRYNFQSDEVGSWVTICQDITKESIQEPFRSLDGDIWNNLAFFFNFVFLEWPAERENYYFDNLVLKTDGVGTDDISKLENFKMFPNPTNELLTISTDTPLAYAFIYDATGKQVLVVKNPTNDQINVGQLNSGIYFVQMLNESGIPMGNARFIKQ